MEYTQAWLWKASQLDSYSYQYILQWETCYHSKFYIDCLDYAQASFNQLGREMELSFFVVILNILFQTVIEITLYISNSISFIGSYEFSHNLSLKVWD